MLLSRAAENIYWAGRYLERAESAARIVKVHTELFLDLPRSAGIGWAPLLAITGSIDVFEERFDAPDEDSVVAFVLGGGADTGSILHALDVARDDIRSTRTVFPREAWAIVNELYTRSAETVGGAVNRRARIAWLDRVIATSHRLRGLLEGTMCRDAASGFLRIGQLVERADMSTRVLDVQAGCLLGAAPALDAYADVTWMAVLQSLAGYEVYRRRAYQGMVADDVLRFVLQDPAFPRSIEHCLIEISQHLLEFRDNDATMAVCAAMQTLLEETKVLDFEAAAVHDYVDELQTRLGDLHDSLAETYFQPATTAELASA
jgi:uncharacterized alpha-E superfamily protein